MTLKGQRKPHGRFIGTWYKRTDIDQILLQLLMTGLDHDKYDQILVTKDKLNGVQVDTKLYGMNPDGTIVDGIDPLNLTVAAMNAILINSPT